jgi:hypothetical protein
MERRSCCLGSNGKPAPAFGSALLLVSVKDPTCCPTESVSTRAYSRYARVSPLGWGTPTPLLPVLILCMNLFGKTRGTDL